MVLPDCDRYTVLYQGEGHIVQHINVTQPSKYLVVEQEDRVFVLALGKADAVCVMSIWQTGHPR